MISKDYIISENGTTTIHNYNQKKTFSSFYRKRGFTDTRKAESSLFKYAD